MLLNKFKVGNETVVARSGAAKRALAVIACASLIAGCESLPEVPILSEVGDGISRTYSKVEAGIRQQYNETFNAPDEASNSETASASDMMMSDDENVALSRSDVKRVQARLAELGYRSGKVDGILGLKTVKAIKMYQSAHSLPVTGKVSSKFLAHLEANSAAGSSDPMLTSSPY